MHLYTEYLNPHLGKLLSNIKMDKVFVKGVGCSLYDDNGDKYLDFISAYGALPFGYNSSEIWDAVGKMRLDSEPSFVQPSILNAAGELAKILIDIAPEGMKYVTFTNSGAESVEAGIKLCRAATGRLKILSTYNSFHGKTLAALSATGNENYQKSFGAPVNGFEHIEYGNTDSLLKALDDNVNDQYAAFIIEPIQGEGGIVVPPKGYFKDVYQICKSYGVKLIFDEIQTGLGRTGTIFACNYEDVSPDVILLAKALGGGLVPIGACICRKELYTEEFGNKHSSTFAANSLACRVGIATIKRLIKNDGEILNNVKTLGAWLKNELIGLKEKYPTLIKAIHGRGLMMGIEFGITRDTFPGSLIGIMAEQELLTPVLSSYLLNVEKLRVAPTLNGAQVIRIEPPLIINMKQCKKAVNSLSNMLQLLSQGNAAKLLSYLIDVDESKLIFSRKSYQENNQKINKNILDSKSVEGKFAFLVHPVDINNYIEFDKSLEVFSNDQLTKLVKRWNDFVEPFVIAKTRIVSVTGETAYGEFIAISRTAEELLSMPREMGLLEIKAAVQLAESRGARIVGLGAYTAVVSGAGLHLRDTQVPITTGNSYTVVAVVEAINECINRLKMQNITAAIIGATGSIGRGTSILISEYAHKLILIGNPRKADMSNKRLIRVAADVYRHIAERINNGEIFTKNCIADIISKNDKLPPHNALEDEFITFTKLMNQKGAPIFISTAINENLPLADVVVTATSSIDKLVTPFNLKFGAVVCDVSRPPNVSKMVQDKRPDVLVIDGGIIAIPGIPSLGWDFGFPKGLAYACMSETMILALEGKYENMSIGAKLPIKDILYIREASKIHGFELADLRSFDRPLDTEVWDSVLTARNAVLFEQKVE